MLIEKIWDQLNKFFEKRLLVILVLFVGLFAVLACRLFQLQIIEGNEHEKNFTYKSMKTIELPGTRGNIYDANGNLLASNKVAYCVAYDNNVDYDKLAKEQGNGTTANSVKNANLLNLAQMIRSNGDKISSEFPIALNQKNQFYFTIQDENLRRFKLDSFGVTDPDNMSEEQKKQMTFTAKEMFQYFRSGYGSSVMGNYYDISEEYSERDALTIMSIRYTLSRNVYTQYKPATIAYQVSEETVAQIEENPDVYVGATVETESIRVYNDSEYFSHIIGYTGVISEEELKEYNKNLDEEDTNAYSSNDIVGKIGVEKELESELRGYNGYREVFVDSLGRILDENKYVEAVSGNNVYLSIDAKLQKYCYKTLEKKLVNILLSHMTSGSATKDGDDNVLIPYYKLLYAFIDNNLIDISAFGNSDASVREKAMQKKFDRRMKEVLASFEKDIFLEKSKLKNWDAEQTEYAKKAYSVIKNNLGLVKTELVDENSETYQDWLYENCSLKDYLEFLIKNDCINLTELHDVSTENNTVYEKLIQVTLEELKEDPDFDKLIYKYMLKSGRISGKDICMTLYHQGFLDKKGDKDYVRLKSDALSPYDFIRAKLKNLEVTPAQLALEPCSGSIVVTDPNTGKVKALVSYPGYDNNRLANGVDSDYYQQLRNDKSYPLLNRATQSKCAPGSTYKIVSATAGISEGVVSPDTYLECNGIYKKVFPPAKCWIYPNAHGYIGLEEAIEVSCNSYFFEIGRQLGLEKKKMNNEKSLEIQKKYATLFGLDETSGIELSGEAEPHISDQDAIRSAIGQGTHNYAPSQLARYITTVANRGDTYNLSIFDSIQNHDGDIVKSFDNEPVKHVELPDSTWNTLHNGLYRVVNNSADYSNFFRGCNFSVAGKTGTAEEDLTKPAHALFVSYGPSASPEIAVTTVLQHGYSSKNAVDLTSKIYKYYFHVDKNET